MTKRKSAQTATVVALSEFREKLRVADYQEKISAVLDANRRAIGRLYSTGALFSREGAKAGRDLLLAHQHLLKVVGLLEQLDDVGAIPAPRTRAEVARLYDELDLLLAKTTTLTARTGAYLSRLSE